MSKLNPERFIKIFTTTLLIMLVFFNVVRFLENYQNTKWFSGIDLRNRIVGTRLAESGFDPYTFQWTKDSNSIYIDPLHNTANIVSRVIWPPTVLVLSSPAVFSKYANLHFVYYFIQWALMIGSILLVVTTFSKDSRKYIWITGLSLALSFFWSYHLERAQIYIYYTFLFSLAWWLLNQNYEYYKFRGLNKYLAGFCLGLAVSLRPSLGVVIIPFLVLFLKKANWKIIIGSTIGFISIFLLSITKYGFILWQTYFKSMQIYTEAGLHIFSLPIRLEPSLISEYGSMGGYIYFVSTNSSFIQTFHYFTKIQLPPYIIQSLIILAITLVASITWKFRNKVQSKDILLIGMGAVILVDILLPNDRGCYNEIMWLTPLLILTGIKNRYLRSHITLIILLILLSIRGNVIYLYMIQYAVLIYILVLIYGYLKRTYVNRITR